MEKFEQEISERLTPITQSILEEAARTDTGAELRHYTEKDLANACILFCEIMMGHMVQLAEEAEMPKPLMLPFLDSFNEQFRSLIATHTENIWPIEGLKDAIVMLGKITQPPEDEWPEEIEGGKTK